MATYLSKRMVEIRPLMDKVSLLKEQINELTSQKEMAQTESNKAIVSLNFLRSEFDLLDKSIETSKKEVNDYIESVKGLLVKTIDSLKDSDMLSSQFTELIKILDGKLTESIKEFEQIKQNKELAQKEITAQEERLSKRFEDLDKYRNRLDKKCKELGIDIIIKL